MPIFQIYWLKMLTSRKICWKCNVFTWLYKQKALYFDFEKETERKETKLRIKCIYENETTLLSSHLMCGSFWPHIIFKYISLSVIFIPSFWLKQHVVCYFNSKVHLLWRLEDRTWRFFVLVIHYIEDIFFRLCISAAFCIKLTKRLGFLTCSKFSSAQERTLECIPHTPFPTHT